MSPLAVALIIFELFALSRAVLRYRHHEIPGKEFALWVLVWGTALIATAVPNLITDRLEGISAARAIDLIDFVAMLLLFYLLFRLYVKADRLDKDITRLTIDLAKRAREEKQPGNHG